jgi:dimethylargininase
MLKAFVRGVSRRISDCELTFIDREGINLERAVEEHRKYQDLLVSTGIDVTEIPADDSCPDCCFLEDTALVLDEIAVIARPGSDTRRREVAGVRPYIEKIRKLALIEAPATLEGGDVLRVGRELFVGVTTRTNLEGIQALRAFVEPHGYKVSPVATPGALHLKSVCTALDDGTILAESGRLDTAPFRNYEILQVSEQEWMASNVLRAGSILCMHSGFPKTRQMLDRRGYDVRTTDISEFLKAEAGLTCMSILFSAQA